MLKVEPAAGVFVSTLTSADPLDFVTRQGGPHVSAWRVRAAWLCCAQMFTKYIIILFVLGAIPWAIYTLWEMHRSHGPRERAWVGRASVGLWLGSLIATMTFVQFLMKGQLFIFALPVFIVAGLGARFGLRKVRARIRLEESDPFSRARPLN